MKFKSRFIELYNLLMEDITSQRKPIQKVDAMSPKDFIRFLKEFLPYVKDGKVDLNDIRISEKVDGCLDENTIIETLEYGEIPVKELVEKFKDNKNIHLKALDHDTNEIIYTNLIETSVKDNIDNWNLIELENGKTVILTDEHPVYLPELKCYRKVSDLQEGDVVLVDER